MNFLFWVDSGQNNKYLGIRRSLCSKQWAKTVVLECSIQLRVWGCCKLTHFPHGSRAKPWQKLKGVVGSSNEPIKWSDSKQLVLIIWHTALHWYLPCLYWPDLRYIVALQVSKYRERKSLGCYCLRLTKI